MDVGGWYIDDLAGAGMSPTQVPSGTEYDSYSCSTTQYDTVFHRIGDEGAWCEAIKLTPNPTTSPRSSNIPARMRSAHTSRMRTETGITWLEGGLAVGPGSEHEMTAPHEIWRQVADRWFEVYAQIGDGQWDNPTPCEGWTVHDLVDHLQWHVTALRMLGADTRPGGGWEEIRSDLDALLSDPSRLEGNVDDFGGMPKSALAAFLVGDRLIHTWDLARSIGVDETLPPEAVAATMEGLQHVPVDLLRGRNPLGLNMMGDPVAVPDDVTDQDKMLAYTGRRP